MKHALVTGCSRGGIGFALCHALSTKGIHVFATARTLSRMTELQDLPNVTLLALDVTNKASIAAAVEAVRKETGGTLDYLFNNAGMSQAMPLLDADLDEGRAMFEVNVWGAVAMVQAFAPLLIAAQGTVVNLASLVVSLHTLWTSLYVGSKAALDAISETLRLELAPLGVRVVTCVTGIVDTNIMANAAQHELPKGSLYGAAADKIADRASGKELEGISQSSPEQFAQRLVGQVLSGATGKVYPGKLSSVAWFVGKFLPTGWLDAMITRGTGADAVAAAHVVKLEKKQ